MTRDTKFFHAFSVLALAWACRMCHVVWFGFLENGARRRVRCIGLVFSLMPIKVWACANLAPLCRCWIWKNHIFYYFYFPFFKGLVARCHSFCLFFNILVHTFVQSHSYSSATSVAILWCSSTSPHRQLRSSVGKTFIWLPSRDMNSGQPCSKPTHYQLSFAAPYGLKLEKKLWTRGKLLAMCHEGACLGWFEKNKLDL